MRWRLPIIFFLSPIAIADQSGHVHTVRMIMINMIMMRSMKMMIMMIMMMMMMMFMMTQVAHSSESSVYTVAQPHEAQGVYTPDLTQVSKLTQNRKDQ